MKIILALLLSLGCTLANASLLSYNFIGVFNDPARYSFTGNPGSEPLFLGLIKGGSLFSGSFTFDNQATPLYHEPAPLSYTLYPALAFRLDAGPALAVAVPAWGSPAVQVTDDAGFDPEWLYDELIASTSIQLDDSHSLSVNLRMSPADSRAFSGGRVPDGFNGFSNASLNFYLYHNDEMMYDYVGGAALVSLDGASVAVPEPASGLLLLAGLGALAVRRRRT